jgi:SAM-dependent methyltransferase
VDLHILANLACALRLIPAKRHCEFCGWSGFRFVPIYYVDGYRSDVFCPRCRLMDRYRTLIHFVRQSDWGEQVRNSRPRVLDVAPTESSGKMLAKEFFARESVGFDISNPWADITGDLQNMPFSSESFDLFLCYEVLDYIPRDDFALAELYRILKPGGYGLLRVGFDNTLEKTVEYERPDSDDSYHIRRYGPDLPSRFRAAGFEHELVDLTQNVSECDRQQLGIDRTPIFVLRRPRSNSQN